MKTLFFTLFVMLFAAGAAAQTENPRGIYKMITLEGKNPPVKAPFDQYKIVTDVITLTLRVESDGSFILANNDGETLNYTGSEPRRENDHSRLVFDSNAQYFTLKWWSTESDHIFFPDGGWVTEFYESGKYSEYGSIIFKALLQGYKPNEEKPLLGTWRILGCTGELRDTSKVVASLKEKYATSARRGFVTVLPENIVYYIVDTEGDFCVLGNTMNYVFNPDNMVKVGNEQFSITWLDKDTVAVKVKDGDCNCVIYSRVTSNASILNF